MNYFYRIDLKEPFTGGDAKFIDLNTDHIIEGVYFKRAEILCIFNKQNRLKRVQSIFEISGIKEIMDLQPALITSEFRVDLLENSTSGNLFSLDLVNAKDIRDVKSPLVEMLYCGIENKKHPIRNNCYKPTILPLGMIFRGYNSMDCSTEAEWVAGSVGSMLIQFNSDV